ncbi:hypothetical protein C9426_10010 [Serratia sp. S1B]|nr:hypothetical protein C9426_10010 [Serratia sp. S1B]
MREAEEIPFGAVEQDREKMELERRIAELELQLELKVDELRLICSAVMFRRSYNPHGSKVTTTPTYELKILPDYFNSVLSGNKKAEIRKADRPFKVGDELLLREWSIEKGYTGQSIQRVITHITELDFCAPGFVMLSIEPV